MPEDPLRYFRVEARELLDQLGQGVLDLEAGPPAPDLVARLLRAAHTLKGAARVVRQPAIADRTHELEEVLAPFRETSAPVPVETVRRSLRLLDTLNAGVAELSPAPVAAPPAPRPGDHHQAVVIRADTVDVDDLLDAIDEAHAQLAPLRRGLATLEHASHGAQLLSEQATAPAFRGVTSAHDRIGLLAGELTSELAAVTRALNRAVEQATRELRQVRGYAERLRLVPAGSVFTALHRAARDAAEVQGKRVLFEARGGDVRLDPAVLADAHAALLHIVRNAVAHGVEPADQRRAAGKPPEGRIAIDVTHHAGGVTFTCTDDGRGFDLDAIRRAAQRAGRMPANGAPDRAALIDLVLRGGLSTSATVDAVAGRGIGLDVARDVADRRGGTLDIDTEPGRGATVRLTVPLSVASLDVLLVADGGPTVAVPLDATRCTVRLSTDVVASTPTGASVVHDGRAIPLLRLAGALPSTADATDGRAGRAPAAVAVVVSTASGAVALGVDRLLGTDTVVVRALPELARADPVVGGIALDSDGGPRLVLDPDGLVAARPAWTEPEARPARRPILVIDDSLTSRMLEQSILESAGYAVEVAASGEEGLRRAGETRHALYLVDIEMPGMDGYTFVERTRADPVLRNTPAILVSSCASAEDRRRGAEAGACLHVDKAAFDQKELLAHIGKLVG
jgi:two-component system, chemotaxis family, sensor kinase CheA